MSAFPTEATLELLHGGVAGAQLSRQTEINKIPANEAGQAFNERVAGLFGSIAVVNRRERAVLVVECKDMSISRTPYELASEIAEFLHGTAKKRSIIDKHQARVGWVRDHLTEVLQFFGVERN